MNRSNTKITRDDHPNKKHWEDQSILPAIGDLEEHDHIQDYYIQKSILSKVKEMAMKWRNTLSIKRGSNVTPAWGVSLDDDDEGDDLYGVPIYEPEAVHEYKKEEPNKQDEKKKPTPMATTIRDEDKGNPTSSMASTKKDETPSGDHKSDKQLVGKENSVQKLEPGEGERVPSEAPTTAPNELGVVVKVRDAVSSIFGIVLASSPTRPTIPNTSIPISANTQAGRSEDHGRIIVHCYQEKHTSPIANKL